jgi:hypothetical protein
MCKWVDTGRQAYIVPNVVTADEIALSCVRSFSSLLFCLLSSFAFCLTTLQDLGVPLFGASPDFAAVYGSKSGVRRLFAAADLALAPGAHDIYSEADLFDRLSVLLEQYPAVQRWVIKLDDGVRGRGLAFVGVLASYVPNLVPLDVHECGFNQIWRVCLRLCVRQPTNHAFGFCSVALVRSCRSLTLPSIRLGPGSCRRCVAQVRFFRFVSLFFPGPALSLT